LNKIDSKAVKTILFEHKNYKRLAIYILLSYVIFILVYLNRPSLYELDNSILDLIIGSIPNFIPSILFSVIGIFYIVPLVTGVFNSIENRKYLLIISSVNLIMFILIEYFHVVLSSGNWDNIDIVASVLGIVIAYIYYKKVKSTFSSIEV